MHCRSSNWCTWAVGVYPENLLITFSWSLSVGTRNRISRLPRVSIINPYLTTPISPTDELSTASPLQSASCRPASETSCKPSSTTPSHWVGNGDHICVSYSRERMQGSVTQRERPVCYTYGELQLWHAAMPLLSTADTRVGWSDSLSYRLS